MNAVPTIPTELLDVVRAARALVGVMEDVRDDQVSTHMGFGANYAEKKERVRVLTAYIEANAEQIDEALEDLDEALAKLDARS